MVTEEKKEPTIEENKKTERKKASTDITKKFQVRLEDLIDAKKKETEKTQNQIADEIGISHSALSGYASDIKEAGINSLCKIAKYFGVSTDYLLGLNDNPSKNPSRRAITEKLGLSNETINELFSLQKYDSLESKAALTFINAMIESFRLGTTSDSTTSVWQLSRTLLAYTIHNQFGDLHHADNEKKAEEKRKENKKKGIMDFPISKPKESKNNFKFLEDERYKLIMYFEQFIKHFQDDLKIKKKIKKIYDNSNFLYKDYDDVQSLIKRLGDAIIIFEGGKNHTVISHPLAIFFEGIITYERDSNLPPNKAGILPIPKIPKRYDSNPEEKFSTFLDSLPPSDIQWEEVIENLFSYEEDPISE